MDTRYIVEFAFSIEELTGQVNQKINDGYDPIGSLCIREYEDGKLIKRVYYQPMLLKREQQTVRSFREGDELEFQRGR